LRRALVIQTAHDGRVHAAHSATPLTRPTPPPLVIAHRGASVDAPEHTLAAYRAALEQGADGLECDVRLTADGHLVCVHDRRVDRTTDGRGVVSTLELADLKTLDFAARHGGWQDLEDPEQPDQDRSQVLTLETLLGLVVDLGRRVDLTIETKHPTRYAGLVERRLVDLLRRHGLAAPRGAERARVAVMSFSWLGLRRVRSLAPRLPTVLLMDRVPLRFRDGTLPVGVGVAGPSIQIVRSHPRYVRRVQQHGHRVYVWTVNDAADVRRCRDAGVDAVITDRPLATRNLLQR
jgi:glycerophosphoryl diester phosphodiesterase